jgi:hypothetical protein
MPKMGSHDPFGHLQHKLWPKQRSWVKLPVWLPTTESQELTQFPCVQMTCNKPLENSRRGLQLWFRPHLNRRFAQEVLNPQSCGSPNFNNFGTPTWESRDKKPFRCHFLWGGAKYTIWGKVVASPESGPWWVLWGRLWFVLTPKVLQPFANQLVCWFCAGLSERMNCLSLFLVPSWSSNTPLYPFKVLKVREHAPSP